jgi:pullulanase/glycogen debranching enzyme
MVGATTTTQTRAQMFEMFLDATDDEVWSEGRLATRDEGEGVTSLIAYGWNKIAEYDESTNEVTIFAGHIGQVSDTVSGYVNGLEEVAEDYESRTISRIDEAPNVARPPAESVQFIDNYRSFSGEPSSIEEWATETVENAISTAVRNLI